MAPGNDHIEKVLQSVDGIGRASAPDFFYARVMARIQQEIKDQRPAFILLRPAFLAPMLGIIFMLNIFLLVARNEKPSGGRQEGSSASIESFANEYNLGSNGQLYE